MNPLSILLNKCTLNDDNYSEWKRNLNIVLNYNKITLVLSDHEPKALTPLSTPQDIEYHKKWHDANELAKCYVLASMNSILQKQQEGMGNVANIMLHLYEMFGTKTRSAKVKAINAFKDLKQKLGVMTRLERLGYDKLPCHVDKDFINQVVDKIIHNSYNGGFVDQPKRGGTESDIPYLDWRSVWRVFLKGDAEADVKPCGVSIGISGNECLSGRRVGCHGLNGSFRS
ncbi:Uncharacterized protein TCM_018049 [Theobroma cacao]|uniref:Uncharacterized protein n=1 Tax=Theobroma cacao TaxID=3641 RepID=A0A061EE60_THECC|nr:Uncharacterized protein TCM_018049 [Theobroma cacao]